MFLSIQQAIQQGTKILDEAGVAAPRLTAEVLLAHALQRDRSYLFAHSDEPLTELAWIHYGRYLHQRSRRVPTQYITGVQEFYGREFRVNPSVLIPRPETEHVIEAALTGLSGAQSILDLGTGSGNIAVTLALELKRRILAVDASSSALRVASGNARRLDASVTFLCGDFLEPFAAGSLDAIVTNPPYVPLRGQESLEPEVRHHEPAPALFAGEDGLDAYRRLAREAPRVLRPGGVLISEIGFGQQESIQELFGSGWERFAFQPDLAGIPRVFIAHLR